MRRILFTLIIILMAGLSALGTHNSAGEIIYEYIGNGTSPTFKITIITYTDPNSPAYRDTLDLRIARCDQSQEQTLSVPRTNQLKFAPDIMKTSYTVSSYTFPAAQGCYVLSMTDPNRIDQIVNISGSVNVPFYIEDTLIFQDPQFYGFNSSPVLTEPPIDFAKVKEIFIHNPGAYDPDGDSLTFTLIPPKRDPTTDVPGYKFPGSFNSCTPPFPSTFAINKFTGELIWNVPCITGIFNVAILVREYRDGILIGTMIRDMQIRVTNNNNEPPVISQVNDTCVIAGNKLKVTVTGTDPDVLDDLTLTANGGPLFISNNPAKFTTTPGKSPVKGVFEWDTDCSHIRPGFYTVVFKVADDGTGPGGSPQPYVDVETWTIRVVAPPPGNLTATAAAGQINLSWDDPYTCDGFDNFRGFTVWRKKGCDSLILDTCETGGLGALGYQKISGNNPIMAHSYVDQNVTTGLVYSYRVLAVFAESISDTLPWSYNEVVSMPSNEACAQLFRDVPLITHVDVDVTDPASGVIDVRWINPDPEVLDTIQNPGPYELELIRYNGLGTSGTPVTVATFGANTFSGLANDTFYTDSNLDTESFPYTYQLVFKGTSTGGQVYEIGKSDSASSIFLSIVASSGQLFLSWVEHVPWDNYRYDIYRETSPGSGIFDSIGTSTDPSFLDMNLINGKDYCYKIKGFGSYYNPDIPTPQINFSQRKCAHPKDTVPPCPPDLAVTNDCGENIRNIEPDELTNLLTWNNPNNTCADDVVKYRVYYAPADNEPFVLLAEITVPEDTTYLHEDLPENSLAGCYKVTAIDSFDNESAFSNTVCVDNCPFYELPNVFTPNGDGNNDLFTPFMPYYFVDHVDIQIYNRWGDLVYSASDPDINWDGTDQQTGKDVSEGVYYYVCHLYEIRISGIVKRPEPLSGYIHLIRGTGN